MVLYWDFESARQTNTPTTPRTLPLPAFPGSSPPKHLPNSQPPKREQVTACRLHDAPPPALTAHIVSAVTSGLRNIVSQTHRPGGVAASSPPPSAPSMQPPSAPYRSRRSLTTGDLRSHINGFTLVVHGGWQRRRRCQRRSTRDNVRQAAHTGSHGVARGSHGVARRADACHCARHGDCHGFCHGVCHGVHLLVQVTSR